MKEFIIPYSDEISDEDVKQLYGANRRLIRCKDCKHYDKQDKYCGLFGIIDKTGQWFCGDGERDENDEQ